MIITYLRIPKTELYMPKSQVSLIGCICRTVKGKTHWPSFARKIRKEASERIDKGEYPEKEILKAKEISEDYSRAFALASIYRDLCGTEMDGEPVWELALSSASRIVPEWKKEEILEKMASWGIKCGKNVESLPDMLEDRELRMKLLSKLVRISDEKGMRDIWKIWSDRTEKDRYELLRIMVHDGFPEEKAADLAEELSPERARMIDAYISDSGKKNVKNRVKNAEIPPMGAAADFEIALYNTYKGKASEIHFRNISRAAALCYAFELKLAIIGFPFENEEKCIERTVSATRIGDGSEYLRALYRAGAFSVYGDISEIEGKIVATTPYPDENKEIRADDISEGMVFLMGLGHDGLPKNILEKAEYHLEFTGKKASLETCTAMGVLAHMLHIRRKPYIVD